MNKEQEDLIATGLWLLIKSSDKLKTSEKQVWMYDYDKLFPEEEDDGLAEQRDKDLEEGSLNANKEKGK